MNLVTLGLNNIRAQPLSALLTLLLLTLGVGTIVVLMLLNAQFKERMQRDISGIDLVVGAKGSPLQLILSSVYHIDIPTGNIAISEAEAVSNHPLVAATIPLALGDAHEGFRIVGTNFDYLEHYKAELASGELWQQPLQAVLGAEVVLRTGHKLGAEIVGSHGLGGKGTAHHDKPYQVVGILKPTATALDRLILTDIKSVHEVHAVHGTLQAQAMRSGAGAIDPTKEITALLVKYRTPIAAVQLPRLINAQTTMQAASPAFEVARLLQLIGTGADILRGFGLILILVAALSIFIALYSALQKRQFDLAMMRTLGASRWQVSWFIILESLLLSVGGTLIGLLLGHLATAGLAWWLLENKQVFLPGSGLLLEELYLLGLAVLVGIIAAILPAVRAYRLDIAAVLSRVY